MKFIFQIERKKDTDHRLKSFQELIDKKVKIIFTVDCGTLSFEAINFAKKKYRCYCIRSPSIKANLPSAFSIVNPNRLDDKSNLQYLCAAGVSFMFLVSLNRKLRNEDWFNQQDVKEPNLINYLI